MFSFDLRDAVRREQAAEQDARAEPQQNVNGQWFVRERYFASEADARFWQNVEAEKAAARERLQARVAARAELGAHLDAMAVALDALPIDLTKWGQMVLDRLHLEAILEGLGAPVADAVWPSDALRARFAVTEAGRKAVAEYREG